MPVSDSDISFVRRAIRLAMNGRGHVEPNPMVGCVLVREGKIVGEGYHTHFGGPHAEPAALDDCRRRGNSPAGTTAYVTLEPCCHVNKKTPPCAPRLIEAGVARVVIGCLDPNPLVNGQGVAMLRAAGIQVDGPVLEAEARQLIEPFLRSIAGDLPIITLKWAESADGKVAGPAGRRTQISGSEASRLVHQLRARCDAIAVGIGTVLTDDPLLTPRDVSLRKKPLRLVLDRHLRLPLTSQLVRTAHEWPTAVCCNAAAAEVGAAPLERAGVTVVPGRTPSALPEAPPLADQADLHNFLHAVARDRLHVREMLVEPGPRLAERFFANQHVDRLWVFRSSLLIGDSTAPSAAPIPPWLTPTGTIRVGKDTLTEYQRDAIGPSPDFILAKEEWSS